MNNDCTILSTRIINAPRALVFKAWEDPEILKLWWGPEGFTNTFHEFDFTPGGAWLFTMQGPDGTDYPNKNVFENIVSPELIVFNHIEPVHQFKVTAGFDEQENKTKVIFHMLFESAEECAKVKPYIRVANEQNFDRLEAVLSKITVIN
ncbi:SRPBCC family protein [Ferruginibacter sp. SUN106]|uniref:SRPBCC family protein n=1 Tax=Ferruginibacter sp. SUN106 TaxID=2978348 RepID=UPI003D36A44A